MRRPSGDQLGLVGAVEPDDPSALIDAKIAALDDWLKPALADYHVLLLDSRGNGRSSVVLPQTLALRGASVGDLRIVTIPSGTREWEVLDIAYD